LRSDIGEHGGLEEAAAESVALAADKDFSDENWPDPAGAVGNLCGLPAIAVPCGFGADGLPVSLTAMSGAFEESKAISLARFFQGITGWHEKRPPVASRNS